MKKVIASRKKSLNSNPKSKTDYPRKKIRKEPKKVEIPESITSGTILSIDPAVGHLGWAIHKVGTIRKKPSMNLTHYGTIRVKTSCVKGASETLDEIDKIITLHKPDMVTIEDYKFIPGKTKGMYVVPGMIMLIKYLWYKRTGKDTFVVTPDEWKREIIGSSCADKDMIKSVLQRVLSPEIVENITSMFAEIRGKNTGDYGEQDCYDSIGQGLYICNIITRNQAAKGLELY